MVSVGIVCIGMDEDAGHPCEFRYTVMLTTAMTYEQGPLFTAKNEKRAPV